MSLWMTVAGGVVIAEGLHDPAVINDLRVSKAFITGEGQPLDEAGMEGSWHLYWVDVSDAEIDWIQAGTRHAWYAHFWRPDELVVVYDDARFSMHRHDQSTWDLPSGTGLSRVFAASGWISRPTIRWALKAGAGTGATRGARDA